MDRRARSRVTPMHPAGSAASISYPARMAFNPKKLDAILQQAAALYEAGQSGQARQLASDVLKKDPRNIGGLRIFALASTNSMQWPEAVKAAEKAAKLAPRDAGSLTTLATVLIAGGRFAEAMSKARTARKIAPNDPRTQGTYLECLIWTGEFEACRELLEERAKARRLAPGTAASYVGACFETGRYDEAIDAADAFLEDHGKGQPALVVRPLLSLLGRSLEKAGRHPEAVDAYERMNSVVPGTFDVAEADRLTDALIAAFPADLHDDRPSTANSESRLPVFIVGLPRSGTSLLERVVGAHPDAHGAGETGLLDEIVSKHLGVQGPEVAFRTAAADDRTLERIRADYLRGLQAIGGRRERIANKSLMLPRQAGMIGLLFPKATVLFTDRDLEDTAISIWANLFDPVSMAWTTRLDWIGAFSAMHLRLVDHWTRTLPNPTAVVDYRSLAKDPEATVPTIIEACGLPFDDSCLHPERIATDAKKSGRFVPTLSEQQLRRPINTSAIGRAEAFESRLGAFRRGFDSI